MFSLISIVILIIGLFQQNDLTIVASAIFAIAGSIETFTTKYFKNR